MTNYLPGTPCMCNKNPFHNILVKDKKYIFYDKKGFILGIGIWKESYIEEIPKTCGCNGINFSDIDFWIECDINLMMRP